MYRGGRYPREKSDPPFFTENERAVSPVIGVMLMLVVTIIVAALASSFAGGLSDSAEPAPTTAFDINIPAGENTGVRASAGSLAPPAPGCVVLTMIAGEALHSKDLQIIMTYTVPETYNGVPTTNAGKIIKHTLDGALGSTNTWSAGDDPFIPQVHGYPKGTSKTGIGLPHGNGMVGVGTTYFGTGLFKVGEQYWFKDRNAFLGFDVDDRAAYGFQEGSVVHVTIIHTPSGQTVYDKDVVATW